MAAMKRVTQRKETSERVGGGEMRKRKNQKKWGETVKERAQNEKSQPKEPEPG